MEVDLGREPLAERFSAELARRVSDGDRSSVSALVGSWGAGKSWILAHIRQRLPADPQFTAANAALVSFNPWFYADDGALFAGFSSLLVQGTLEVQRARKRVASLLQSIGPAAKFGGVDVSGPVTAIGEHLMASTPERIRAAIAEGLRRTNRKLLVVMDDLDRLSPGELLTVFKLVRLVGDVPGLHYLLAYDEVTLQHLLEQTPLAAGSPERARRYLEKIVEHRFAVPPLTQDQIEAVLFRRLPIHTGLGDATADLDEVMDYRLQGLLSRVITTPRAAERFVDLATSVPAHLWQELPASDLYESLFWRMFAPDAWQVIVDERRFLTGQEMLVGEDERKRRAATVLNRLSTATSGLAIKEDLLESFIEHFPSLGLGAGSNNIAQYPERERGMGDRDFADHYLWLEVPPGAVSEVEIARLLSDMPSSAASSGLNELWTDSARLTLSAVERNIGRCHESRPYLLEWAASVYDALSPVMVDAFQRSDRALRAFSARVIRDLDADQTQALRRSALFAGTNLSVDVSNVLERFTSDPEILSAFKAMAEEAIPRLVNELASTTAAGLTEPGSAAAYFRLARLSPVQLRTVTTTMLDSGTWDGIDLLSLYLATAFEPEDEHPIIRWAEAEGHLGGEIVESIVQIAPPAPTSADLNQLDVIGDRRATTLALVSLRRGGSG
ncbi:KAP family P-loop NTPase fold protein [Microbacterium sp. F2]|uniref:KAP family P-loop NTPase fold protein n=1 Tax=Microbacterium sp. F2 TaxID=3422228 RepID=UPI003FD0243E